MVPPYTPAHRMPKPSRTPSDVSPDRTTNEFRYPDPPIHADPSQMIDHHRRLRVPQGHTIYRREFSWIQQHAHRKLFLRPAFPHRLHARFLRPCERHRSRLNPPPRTPRFANSRIEASVRGAELSTIAMPEKTSGCARMLSSKYELSYP